MSFTRAIVLLAGAYLAGSLAGVQEAGEARGMDLADYWPLRPGTSYLFERQDGEGIAKIAIERDGTALLARFTKDREDMYWFPGFAGSLLWYLSPTRQGLYGGNSRGDHRSVLDGAPDNILLDGSGRIHQETWYVQAPEERARPYLLIPSRFTPRVRIRMLTLGKIGAFQHWVDQQWNVDYSFEEVCVPYYCGRALRAAFTQEMVWNGGTSRATVHEDWFFAEHLGPVRITQHGAGREEPLTMDIALVEVRTGGPASRLRRR